MKISECLCVSLIFLSLTVGASAQKKSETKIKPETPKVVSPCEADAPELNAPENKNKMKIIAEGSAAAVGAPFVFVARSNEDFEKIRSLVPDLASETAIDFTQSAIVAAFAGEKRTGGYSVKIEQTGTAINITENAPPADAMTTQILTYPFQIVVVSVADNPALNVNIPSAWRQSAQIFKISTGTIDYSGGIAGIMKSQPVEGAVRVLRAGDAISLIFDFAGKEAADKDKKINQIVSGSLSGETISVEHFDVGNFSPGPRPADSISGTLEGDKLNLKFTPLPTSIRDGYAAQGSIVAVRQKD